MDESYKLRKDWYHHGEMNSEAECERKVNHWNDEVIGLYKAAEFSDEEFISKGDLGEIAEGESKKEDEFLTKLEDAETPLYPSCANHSKLSTIVSLFRLKTQNGWSDKSFNDLLETLPEMLSEDNVLHTSLYDQKIHACVNDSCLFRKKYKKLKLDNCPKCKAWVVWVLMELKFG